ncbi:MAG: peptide chain release factor 2 [Patescibacteria group bacterium]
MDEILKQFNILSKEIDTATDKLAVSSLQDHLGKLQTTSQESDFWKDNSFAQDVMRQISNLQARISPWQELKQKISDAIEIAKLDDQSLLPDLNKQFLEAQLDLRNLKQQLKYSGPYDDHSAIISIHAGAGGTDAQDWASMLLRMYVRFCEKTGLITKMIDESPGEEAGIKSTTLEASGQFAFGKFKGEHGVHRLVRLSPFNSDNLRQTSFVKVEVVPKIEKPEEVQIDEKDLKIDVYRSGGRGGQSVNTTDSAVRITHLPTNVVVAIQNERSQLQNKETALTILRSKLAQLQIEQHAEKISELKGPNEQAAWGNQIRSYVLHPYKQVKDLRTRYETSDPDAVLDGNIEPFINAYLDFTIGS